ncbi:MAG TPA: hypothetical protein PK511_09050 [Chitinophagales bacterium]|nr:hypothetical protein [Chitinophagales bacterium]HMU69159.1 hypothetical protein [Chitinophagales bacterium]HMX05655.1 hypothetical protein [Chitinophagales bacterium]HMZ90015.1 hypothetical protein [Chitinophagales bacterium]HNA58517.1 hypothetical protein [Chitinophagales bacterium]
MRNISLLLICFIGFTACKNYTGIPDSFDYGRMDGNVYSNTYFDFTFSMPDGWQVMENSVMDSLRRKTQEDLAEKDPELAKTVKAADVRTANLLTIICSKDPNYFLYSANLNFVAENVKIAINVKDGKDYLESAKKNLGNLEYSLDFKGDIYKMDINGVEFYVMNLINHYNGLDIKQSYYASIINGFAFTFVASWITDEQRTFIDEAISKMKFIKEA